MNSLSGYNPLFSSFGTLLPNLSALLSSGNLLSSASAASPSQNTVDSTQVQLSGLGQLLSSLNVFQNSLQQIYASTTLGALSSASSSNPAVASVTASNGASSASYWLNVSQLAQAQSASTSFSLPDSASTAVGSGSLTIATGSYAYSSPTTATSFTANGSPVTISIGSGNNTLAGIANAINVANAGVTANVFQNASGGYQLQISAAATGQGNNFRILASDSDGNNTDQNGLSRLAFDQTQAVGSGQNLTLTQSAQNASYSVNGASASSPGNLGVQLGYGVSASLLTTGSTNVSVNPDYGNLNDQAQALVNAFNTLQASVNSLIAGGGALQNDPIAAQLPLGLNQQTIASYGNSGSQLIRLSQIGVNFQHPSDYGQLGSLSLNASLLQSAYNADSLGAVNLLGGVAQSLDNYANGYASYDNGSIPLTMSALQRAQFTDSLGLGAAPVSNTIPGNLASLAANQSGATQLSAQQISALAMYAMVYSLSAPYQVQALLVGQGLGIGNGLSSTA